MAHEILELCDDVFAYIFLNESLVYLCLFSYAFAYIYLYLAISRHTYAYTLKCRFVPQHVVWIMADGNLFVIYKGS